MPPPDVGASRTGTQSRHSSYGIGGTVGVQGVAPHHAAHSYTSAPAGTYSTYRQMRRNPTVALGRMAIQAPIRAGSWSIEANDAPTGAEDLVYRHVVQARDAIMEDCLRMLDYGWQPFEVVWGVAENARLAPTRFKPLLVDNTEIIIDGDTGHFAGLKQKRVQLDPRYALLFTHDGEAGDLYGRSILENIRESAWWPWEQLMQREGKYATRAAGAIPVVGYVPGRGQDDNGSQYDNHELAYDVLQKLSSGQGIAWPKVFAPWAAEQIAQGVDPDKLMAWTIDFLEPKADHFEGFTGAMQHKESLMLRGLLVPERAVTEGSHGTKAEAESHGQIALMFAEEVHRTVVASIQRHVVDPLMAWNYGEQAVGSLKLNADPLTDAKRAVFVSLVDRLASTPLGLSILGGRDLDAVFDAVGIPEAEEPATPPPPAADDANLSLADVDLTPPQGMRSAARNGLKRHEDGETGDGLKPETVRRANRIADGEALTESHVIEMAAWFARHGENRQPAGTPWYAAWQLWGGDAGARWSKRKAEEIKRAKQS